MVSLWYVDIQEFNMATTLKSSANATTIRFNDDYTRNIAEKAAQMQGTSLSGFIMSAIRSYGETVIRERMQAMQEFGPVVLSPVDYTALLDSMDKPHKPNAALKKAMADYKKLNIKHRDY
jgi:uncharacterized protein (DUF1778 family)